MSQYPNSNIDSRFTARQNETIRTETNNITSNDQTSFTTPTGHTVERPEMKRGERATEVIRYFPGGVEIDWKILRTDGLTRTASQMYFDTIPN